MRIAIALIAAACVATPALAQDRPEARMADKLADPAVQDGLAAGISALAGIVLDTRVGPLARYSDGRIRPGDTLRDMKRREDPAFEARFRNDTRRSLAMAGAVAGDMAAMVGALRDTTARLNAAVAPFVDYAAESADDY